MGRINRRDICIALLLGLVIFILMFCLLGFAEFGITTPLNYSGGDEFEWLFVAKNIAENGWFSDTDRLGAPFGAEFEDYTGYYLWNADCLIIKAICLFTDDPAAITNTLLLLAFALSTISAYLVMRESGLGRAVSALGSVLFGVCPYIVGRAMRILHYNLACCYFVPLSALVCLWSCKEKLTPGRKLAAVVFCALIANNGWGYYPIFTCFFLCVTAVYTASSRKRLKAALRPLTYVVCITAFFLLALAPVLRYWYLNGSGAELTERGAYQTEMFGLKLSQLFIPMNRHGIPIIKRVVNAYNGNMLFVNENITSYLGLAGIIGLLISVCCALFHVRSVRTDTQTEGINVHFIGVLIICGFFLATEGGISGLIAFLFPFLRSYNRISVYFTFLSILTFCSVVEKWWAASIRDKKPAVVVLLSLLALACLYDVLPTPGANRAKMEYNLREYQSDKAFVSQVEASTDDGAMIFQLPYHSFPEAGSQRNMGDYHQFTGYLFSRTLKWSYGGIRGRESDEWHKLIDRLPIRERIDEICRSGFSGIYVDTRAFSQEETAELRGDIESAVGGMPLASADGDLLFYDLTDYIRSHPEFLTDGAGILSSNDYLRFMLCNDPNMSADGVVTIREGQVMYGPYIIVPAGDYVLDVDVQFEGEDSIPLNIATEKGERQLYEFTLVNGRNTLPFTLSERTTNLEFVIYGQGGKEIRVTRLAFYPARSG